MMTDDELFELIEKCVLEYKIPDGIFTNLLTRYDPLEIDEWCVENLKGKYYFFGNSLYAEYDTDLVAFKLRWS